MQRVKIMQENLEIEIKALINKEDFDKLCSYFNITEIHFFKQTNHYFDTVEQEILHQKSALRIREVDNKYILTLKRKEQDEVIEYEQEISKDEFELYKNNKKGFNCYLKSELIKMKIDDSEIIYLTSLTTKRAVIKYLDGELFFDINYYSDNCDYEIEYETYSYDYGVKVIKELFNKLGIKFIVNPISKRARATNFR